jgi:hypothetical protein
MRKPHLKVDTDTRKFSEINKKKEQEKSLRIKDWRNKKISRRKHRTVDRTIKILEKALQGVQWEGSNSTEKAIDEEQIEMNIREPLEQTREGYEVGPTTKNGDNPHKTSKNRKTKPVVSGNGSREDKVFQGTSPILAETNSAEETYSSSEQAVCSIF